MIAQGDEAPRKPAAERFDWEAAKRRLSEASQSLLGAEQLSPEESAQLLNERSRQLAQVPAAIPDHSEILEVVGFRLGVEQYAIATEFVLELTRPRQITPIPGSDAHTIGVTNLRGEVTLIVDLGRFLGVRSEREEGYQVLVLGHDKPVFAIIVDGIEHVMLLQRRELAEPAGVAGIHRELMLGCTAQGALLFDGEALFRCETLYVDQTE